MTVEAGRVAWDWNARAGTDYRERPPDCDVRTVDKVVLPPKRGAARAGNDVRP